MWRRQSSAILGAVALIGGLLAVAPSASAVGETVCYYDTSLGAGNPSQLGAIAIAGGVAADVTTPDAAGLAGCHVLFAQNPSNGDFGAEWLANLADIDAAVSAGMALVFHDRYVTGAPASIPGLGATTCVRDFSDASNVNVATAGTTVTNGPAGIIDDTSLDGGNSSTHGYCTEGTLPAGGVNILSTGTAANSITMAYPHGSGFVLYSTIPLDFYLEGFGPNPPRDNFANIYAPNTIAYAAENVPAPQCGDRPYTIIGTDEADVLVGTNGDDVIYGGGGSDVIDGLKGNDLICGGPGDDIIDGGVGHDVIRAGPGNDTVSGGTGNDLIHGDKGADLLMGDGGADTVYGGQGNDQLYGGDHPDFLHGGGGNDDIAFGEGGIDTCIAELVSLTCEK